MISNKKRGKSGTFRASPKRGKTGSGRYAAGFAAVAAILAGAVAGCAVLWLGLHAMRGIGHLEGIFKAGFASLYVCMLVAALVTARFLPGARSGSLIRPSASAGAARSGTRRLPWPVRLLLPGCVLSLLLLWHLHLDRTPYGFLLRMGQYSLLLKAAAAMGGALALYALTLWAARRRGHRR